MQPSTASFTVNPIRSQLVPLFAQTLDNCIAMIAAKYQHVNVSSFQRFFESELACQKFVSRTNSSKKSIAVGIIVSFCLVKRLSQHFPALCLTTATSAVNVAFLVATFGGAIDHITAMSPAFRAFLFD